MAKNENSKVLEQNKSEIQQNEENVEDSGSSSVKMQKQDKPHEKEETENDSDEKEQIIVDISSYGQNLLNVILAVYSLQRWTKRFLKQRNNRRFLVVNEIIETEKNYVQDLEIFMNPLLEQKIFPPAQITLMFSNCAKLLEKHKVLFSELQNRVKTFNETTTFGDILLERLDFMLNYYTTYCVNFPKASAMIMESVKTVPRFATFIKEAENNPLCKYNDVGSFLISPVQRIMRYPLLVSDLVKKTFRNHPDFYDLCTSLGRIEDIVDCVNMQQKDDITLSQ